MAEERLQAVVISVVAGDNAAGAQVRFQELQHVKVKFFGAVQKDHVDIAGWIRERFADIADAKLNPFFESRRGEVLSGASHL